jgi:hypothetical protein
MLNIILGSIIILLLLLILLLLNKKEHFQADNKRKYILFTSAGDNTEFYKMWCEKQRNYDIWLVYYGSNDDNYNKYSQYADKIWKHKGSKFQNFYYIYQNYKEDLMNYERYFIVDDDIIISTDDINKLFDISVKYDLWICQPSITYESKLSHEVVIHQPGNLLRYTSFVEVNLPVFSKNALLKFLEYYDTSLIGWGIDFLYIWANGIDVKDKYAVIDSIKCINPQDEEKKDVKREVAKIDNYNTSHHTWYKYSIKIGCPYSWKGITYETIKL